MEDRTLGSFYFKKNDENGIEGEYTNQALNTTLNPILPQKAALLESRGENFEGTYRTSWIEWNGHTVEGRLEIDPIAGSKKLKLFWTAENGDGAYEGEGFVVGDVLLGTYRYLG